MSPSARLLPLVLLVLTACPGNNPGGDDAGTQEVPDLCNSRDEALSQSDCQLTLGQPLERYISFGGDQDWYSVRMPATVGPRSLLTITAGYAVSATAVNLAVSVLDEQGHALADRKVDLHGQGAPKPLTFLLPATAAGTRVVLLLTDEPSNPSRPGFDAFNPYSLQVNVVENPDPNEPNDTAAQATPLPLTNQSGILVGTATGYLATAGDVDRFAFTVPVGKIVYVRLTEPAPAPPEPPVAYTLSYKLLRPDQTAEAEGRVITNVLAADLGTARRAQTAGTWQVQVQAWNSGTTTDLPPGDLRVPYSLEVRVLDEADPNDQSTDNDDLARARVATLDKGAPPAKGGITGRLATVADRDWYAVDLPSNTAPTVLHFRVVPLSSGGRFPALPEIPERVVRVLTEMPGASSTDCTTKPDVCPKGNGYGTDSTVSALVNGWCTNTTPLCLRSSREESEYFSALHNFEGTLPVAAHTATVRYYFLVQDQTKRGWADDKDYRLELEWLADADEASRLSGGVEAPTSKTMASDDAASFFPAPPTGDTFEVHGAISHGMGRLVANDPTKGQGVRGLTDYDAVLTDVDTFVFGLPTSLPAPMDRTWELQWEVDNLSDGGTPYGLALDLTFCDADKGDGGTTCVPVSTGSAGAPLTLAYRGDPLRAWYSPAGSLSNLQPLYSLQRGATTTKVTVQPYACSCLEPRFLKGGTLKVAVSGVDRTDYGQANYTLRTAYTSYPRAYTRLDGGSATCPAPDGGAPGCFFTRQP